MIRKIFLSFLLALFLAPMVALADEGMWLPWQLDQTLMERMQAMGLNLTREQVFSTTEPSVMHAIVSIGGCTAEMISPEGLLLTNHHCATGRIQAHSTVERNLLRDGFWAMTRAEELPNPGMVARFLVRVEDVTKAMNTVLRDDMTEAERTMAIRTKSAELEKKAVEGTHYTATVRPMFAGNEFSLFVIETFTDVRLVGAPPNSIGWFGGDTDNWMWPRHTGDFTLFRVYTGPDGKPADFSPDNVPLIPRHYLPISIRGVNEGDFAMIMGFPGATQRYLTSYGIDFNMEMQYPPRIEIRRRKLDIIEAAMAVDEATRIQYATRQSGIANWWKKFIGMKRSLELNNVAESKRERERRFTEWANAQPERKAQFGNLMAEYSKIYEGLRTFNSMNFIYMEAMPTGPLNFNLANAFNDFLPLIDDPAKAKEFEEMTTRLRGVVERTFRNYNAAVEQQLWAAMFEEYANRISREKLPAIFQTIERRYRNDFNRFAADVFRRSIFANPERLNRFLDKPNARTLRNDPIFVAARSVQEHFTETNRRIQEYQTRLDRAERLYIRGLREMNPDALFYPDANGTMRLTFGTISGYQAADAVFFNYVTTLSGVMAKENPNHHEFIVPAKLRELYENKNFGPYAENGNIVVNFISNNDITGGNSGSPVINGDGHLIGLAFDGNWEAMSGDIMFENTTQRSISVDARYILFIIDKFAGARHLIDEMTIIK